MKKMMEYRTPPFQAALDESFVVGLEGVYFIDKWILFICQ